MTAKIALLLIVLLPGITASFAQMKLGDNVTSINSGSILEIETTNQGVLLPRISLSSISSWGLLGTAAQGMAVYNTNASATGGSGTGIYYWDNSKWNYVVNSSYPWSLTGNAGTMASTSAIGVGANNNFIGTTDAKDWVMATNNFERMRIASGGNIGIGTVTPSNALDVNGTINTGKASGNNGMLQFTSSDVSGNTVTLKSGNTTSSYSLTLPVSAPVTGQALTATTGGASATLGWTTPTTGTVTSIGLSLPATVFSVSGSPVTGSGTLTGSFNTQTANTVFAGPSSGGAAVPAFRALVSADLPLLGQSSSTVYSSASLHLNATGTYTALTGVTQTITVPSNSVVMLSTQGGLLSKGVVLLAGQPAAARVAFFDNGSQIGNSQLVFTGISNLLLGLINGNVPAFWSMTQSFVLSAGSHTITVRVQLDATYDKSNGNGGTDFGSASDNGLQAALTSTILKQ